MKLLFCNFQIRILNMVQPDSTPTKSYQIWLPLLLSLMMVIGMIIGTKLRPSEPTTKIVIENDDAISKQIGEGRIEELIRYIEAKYVDEVESDKMIEEAIKTLIGELDPHSNYLTADELVEVNEQLQGNFHGIGVEFMMLDDTIVVIKPIKDGPSEAVGIIEGDRIVEINDTIVTGDVYEISKVMQMLRGEVGSKVKVGVLRVGEQDIREFEISRAEIPVYSVDVANMLDESTGYIKLNRFSATTYNEFMKGLERLVEEHQMTDLVIDLRQNPGGYLQEATKILSQLFKEKDQLLVYTEGRAVHRNDYESTGQNFFDVNNIVVLIDEGSASASEILAGAIQDLDRGVVIGRRSFGKGLVQDQYLLKDGSALRLTVARYYTPSGRSIQRSYDDDAVYRDDLEARYNSGELVDESKVTVVDSLVFKTKNGRLVYGGGGIAPDIFVPIDTVLFNDYYHELQQYVSTFSYKYYQKNKSILKKNTIDDFIKNFEVSDTIFEEFLDYAEKKDINRKPKELDLVKDVLKEDIKTRLAKHIFNENNYFRVVQSDDEMIREALKALNSPNPLVSKKNSVGNNEQEF